MMMKSQDGGATWREVDGDNRPETGDLESVDGRQVGDRIHIVHQITETVHHHVFLTSDHPTHPDSWGLRDEVAATAEAFAQTATLVARSDGTLVTVFLADRLHYATRSANGSWSEPLAIDAAAPFINAGPQAVADRNDIIHLAYFTQDGSIWYRRLLADGTLTPRERLASGAGTSEAEFGAVLPLAYHRQSDTVLIAYRLADGSLWERRVSGHEAPSEAVMITAGPVITDAVDSAQPAADIVSDGANTYALFVEQESRSISGTRFVNGAWQPATVLVDGIEGSWVRGNLIAKPDGSLAYGYVYDAGSQGGAGLNRYAEVPLGDPAP
jgi:hypothetical protein